MNKQKTISFRAIIAAILALTLVFCTFSACSGKSSDGKKSSETAKSEEKKADGSVTGTNIGDIIKFGTYEQDNDTSNGKEEIEWIVLEKEGNKALIVSKYALDCQQYNTEWVDVTWETCTLRKWLNEDFLNEAFSSEEQSRIQTTNVVNNDSKYGTSGGNDTEDKIFLLSTDEVEKYFSSDEARMCAPTAYAIAQGVYTSDRYETASGEASCWWWLRSPGGSQGRAAHVRIDGSVEYGGYGVNSDSGAVRPALWINL